MMTGIGIPFSILAVCALNALQNSMMLRPRWPNAGPIGGDGFAAPAGTCNLRNPVTFFAIDYSFGGADLGGWRPPHLPHSDHSRTAPGRANGQTFSPSPNSNSTA